MSSGSHETGSTAKKVTASESAKPRPHIHIFFLSQGSRVWVEMGTKSEKVCMCVCDGFLHLGTQKCQKRVQKSVNFTLYLQGPWSLLAQIWYGAFYIWGIDAIKFLWRLGEGAGC